MLKYKNSYQTLLSGITISALVCQASFADIIVDPFPIGLDPNGQPVVAATAQITLLDPVARTYRVAIAVNAGFLQAPVTVNVRSTVDAQDVLQEFIISSPVIQTVAVNLGQGSNRLKSVGRVRFDTSVNNFNRALTQIQRINVSSGVTGPIELNGVVLTLPVMGPVGDILLVPHKDAQSNILMRVEGSFVGTQLNVPNTTDYDAGTTTAPRGQIVSLDVTGAIGSSQDLVDIRVGRNIDSLRAGEINATIRGTGTSGAAAYVPLIDELQTVTTGSQTGIFRGRIDAQTLQGLTPKANFMRFAGDMLGTIRLGNTPLQSGSTDDIAVPANGLKGQIIINALNSGGAWNAPVFEGGARVGPISGSTPPASYDYTVTAASLGGGAVGVVPYRLHKSDSLPLLTLDGSGNPLPIDPALAPSPTNPIKLRHYGPVSKGSATGPGPFTVERRRAGSTETSDWRSGQESCFTLSVDQTNAPTIAVLTPSRKLQAGFEYRVTHVTTGSGAAAPLTCVLAEGTPPVVSYEYIFTICGLTPGDADDNLTVNFDDMTSVLANFGEAGSQCLSLGDADRNGSVNFDDMTTVLANFGTSYCNSGAGGGEGLMAGAAQSTTSADVDGALAAMGYEGIEAFVGALMNAGVAERDALIAEFGQLLQGGSLDQ